MTSGQWKQAGRDVDEAVSLNRDVCLVRRERGGVRESRRKKEREGKRGGERRGRGGGEKEIEINCVEREREREREREAGKQTHTYTHTDRQIDRERENGLIKMKIFYFCPNQK